MYYFVAIFHILTVVSLDPDIINFSSKEKQTEKTISSCFPINIPYLVSMFHKLIALSTEPVTIN